MQAPALREIPFNYTSADDRQADLSIDNREEREVRSSVLWTGFLAAIDIGSPRVA